MEPEIDDDEVLSDSESSSTRRASSSDSIDMPKVNRQSIRPSLSRAATSNDLSQSSTKFLKEQKPVKVIVVNGKCSKVFKSTLEECVEDCILKFSDESNSIYVSKSGQVTPIPTGTHRPSNITFEEPSSSRRPSARSNRQRNSTNQYNSLPQIGPTRNNLTSTFSLPTATLAVSTATRLRHQLVQQRFSRADHISEESSEENTVVGQSPVPGNTESEEQSRLPGGSRSPNPNIASTSLPVFASTRNSSTYRDRQRDYRLSDLVMFGPEYFADVFHFPRQQNRKTAENLTELDRVKQDLFHRYLWTQTPQVSCRIRPITSFSRSSTSVI